MGELKRRRVQDTGNQLVAGSLHITNGTCIPEADPDLTSVPSHGQDAGATAGQNAPAVGPAEPSGLQEFSRMLSMSRRSKLTVTFFT